MANYQFVNLRFNMDKEEEKELYIKLNTRNRAGHVKTIIKKFFLLDDENLMKKVELKSIIREIMDNEMDIKKDKKIIQSDSLIQSGIKIIVGGSEKQIWVSY